MHYIYILLVQRCIISRTVTVSYATSAVAPLCLLYSQALAICIIKNITKIYPSRYLPTWFGSEQFT